MSKKLSKEILKHSVLAGLIFAFLYIFPLIIDRNAMSPIYTDISCGDDIDGDGILNIYDDDIDGDGLLNEEGKCISSCNDDDTDVDGDGENDPEGFMLQDCKIEKMPLMSYYPLLLVLIAPTLSAFHYRQKVSILIYRECFSICFLTLTIGIILGELFMMFILTSFSFDTSQFLSTLQGSVFRLVLYAAYSFLLALFLKKE